MSHAPATLRPGILSVSAYTGFEPFVFERDGALCGCDVDILQAFCARHALTLALRPVPRFQDLWLAPLTDAVDLAAAGIARFVEREHPDLAWTRPYFEVERSILVHRGATTTLRSIADFSGHTIGFVAGSTADLDTRARAPRGTLLRPVANQREGMALLRGGALSGLAMGTPSNTFNAHGGDAFELIDVHRFAQDEGLRFALAGSAHTLLASLDAFIDEGRANGSFDACFERWMRDDPGT